MVVEIGADLLDAGSETVADLLELVHGQHPWPAQARDAEVDPLSGEGGAEEPCEGQLHRGDLPAQIRAGVALVVLVEDGVEALRRRRGDHGLLRCEHLVNLGAFEQVLHRPPH